MRSSWKAFAAILAGLLGFAALDSAVFRSGWYARYLEPSSSAGAVELTFLRERKHQAEWKEPLVLTMGDSRMNYSPKLANEYSASKSYRFRLTHGGVAGTNPRTWHYMLREIDPTARRYAAIVLPVDDYDDEDTYIDFTDYPLDVRYLAMLLRWTDAPEYPLSYTTPKWALEAWRACLFRGLNLQPDLLAFVADPKKRIADAKANRDWWPDGSYDFLEEEKNVVGLAVNWETRSVSYPPGADDFFKKTVETVLLRPNAPQTGRYGAYRRKWFGKIFERYAGSPTKFIFVRLPRGPVIRPAIDKVSHSIREFATRPGVLIGEEARANELERPELFKDALHMNRAGSTRYSVMLADDLARMLGAL